MPVGRTPPPIELTTLTDGGQPATRVAAEISAFLNDARESLDLALYDVRLETEAGALVLASLLAAHQRGLRVRLLYDVSHPGPIPVPPPPETRPEAIEALPVETRGIAGIPDLMHHKFCVRDGRDVWTGSLNWTEDSWTRQENVVVRVLGSERLAFAYALAFDELWEGGIVARAGRVEPRPVALEEGISVRPWFTPGHGDALSHRVAQAPRAGATPHPDRVARADRRADPRHARRGRQRAALPGRGSHRRHPDGRCLPSVGVERGQRLEDPAAPHDRSRRGEFAGKASTPWSPDRVHDSMHAKVVVADDVAFVGSFNFSRSGERNAENVLEIHDPVTADALARYVDELRQRYPRATPPDTRAAVGAVVQNPPR